MISNALVPELSVTDFHKSLDFYTRILGFSVAYKREEEGWRLFGLLPPQDIKLLRQVSGAIACANSL